MGSNHWSSAGDQGMCLKLLQDIKPNAELRDRTVLTALLRLLNQDKLLSSTWVSNYVGNKLFQFEQCFLSLGRLPPFLAFPEVSLHPLHC